MGLSGVVYLMVRSSRLFKCPHSRTNVNAVQLLECGGARRASQESHFVAFDKALSLRDQSEPAALAIMFRFLESRAGSLR